jgi:hypothetical protein
LLLGGIIFLILYTTNQSIYKIRTYENPTILPLETGTFNFKGLTGTYETIGLGCYDSSGSAGGYYIGTEGNSNLNSDNELHFCNSLDSGSNLLLSSSNAITGSENGGDNYIETKITLPSGKIKINYDYSVTSYYGDGTFVIFNIDGVQKRFGTPHFKTTERGGSISGSDSYEFELKDSKEVIFKIQTTTYQKNENVIGNMEISFEPNTIEITPNETEEKEIEDAIDDLIEDIKQEDLSDKTEDEVKEIIKNEALDKGIVLTDAQVQIIANQLQKRFPIEIVLGIIIVIFIFLIILLVSRRK